MKYDLLLNAATADAYKPTLFRNAVGKDDELPPLDQAIVQYSQKRIAQVKTFIKNPDGSIVAQGYKSAYKARPSIYHVYDIVSVYQFLLWAENQGGSVVVRGHPANNGFGSAHRRMRPNGNGKAPFTDVPRSWVCIDIDKLAMPKGLSYASPADVAEYAVSLLPQNLFWDVSYVFQLSSSAGIMTHDVIKLHLWLWLKQPRDSLQLRGWGKTLGALIDTSLYNGVQPHITARPIFIGMEDPFPVRTELVLRKRLCVPNAGALLPSPPPPPKPRLRIPRRTPYRASASAKPNGWQGATKVVDRGSDPLFAGWPPFLAVMERDQSFHSPIHSLLLSYFGRGGDNNDDVKAMLRREVPPRNTSNRSDVNNRYLTDAYLDDQIVAARNYISVQNAKKEH